ncbi:uncharacterized protein LOC115243653 [Formica exsecta]|uniref:uncharacterized protein LOC115243653 n=1 Tax=Formica exsecta TaxID=72781 RepID=UPI0011430C40|nr:uncharacterized protein LOC115243653 [Formica exsecta]
MQCMNVTNYLSDNLRGKGRSLGKHWTIAESSHGIILQFLHKRDHEHKRTIVREREEDPRDHKRSIGLADRLVGGRQPAAKHKRSLPSAKDNRALPSSSLLRVSSMPQPDGYSLLKKRLKLLTLNCTN